MNQLILHIPHSSTKIPVKNGFTLSDALINAEILKLTDWYTDDLFHSAHDITIKADFSRLFCDPERFSDDSQEVMAKLGMGVLYEKTDLGELMRIVSPELRESILVDYYWPHHTRLNDAVNNQLSLFSKATIIDCHSFSNIPFTRDSNQEPDRPDFNIGTDSFHTPQKLINVSAEFFENKGFSAGINRPYQGSIVPMVYYRKNKNVQTIMLEINRKLYLKEQSNKRSERYSEIRDVIKEFLEAIKN